MAREAVGMSGEAKAVLLQLLARTLAIASAPEPPKYRLWDLAAWEADREDGPLYSPAQWFGGGESLDEAARVRFLRAIRKLAEGGLLTMIVSEHGGRLQRLRLTEEGERVAKELAAKARAKG